MNSGRWINVNANSRVSHGWSDVPDSGEFEITGLIPGSNLPSGSWQDQVSYFHAKQLSAVPKEINKKQFNVFLYRIVKNEF